MNKKKIIALSLGAIVALSGGIYGLTADANIFSPTEKKVVREQLLNEAQQLKQELQQSPLPKTEAEINQRIEKSNQLKQKAIQASDLGDEIGVEIIDSAKQLALDLSSGISALEDYKKALDPNNPNDVQVLQKIDDKLKLLTQIDQDYKSNKKPVEELKKQFDVVRTIKIK
jgi:hypothetical protein